jgi:hypothetical protein
MKMTTDDKQFLKDFLSGVMLGVGTLGVVGLLAIILNGAANWLESQPSPPDQKFEVVDRYQDRCDVVRYTDSSMATYKYFLDCKDK